VIRALTKFALTLTALLLLPVLLIRAQPYDGQSLRSFLLPPQGCPMPCFMGIRPGVTMAWDALALLESSDQVGRVLENFGSTRPEVIDYQLPPTLSIIDWRWNEGRWMQMEKHGSLVMFNRQVSAINLYTPFSLGDMLLTYGFPDEDKMTRTRSGGGAGSEQFQYDGWYDAICMRIIAAGLGRRRGVYLYPVNISFERQRPDVYDESGADSRCGA
jgi:hypothetical protein